MRWTMTEDEWKRMYKEHKERIEDSNNFYGAVQIGKLSVEFCHTMDKSAWYLYADVFEYGKDGGYAFTERGVPYDLLDCDIHVPLRCKTFESFKENVEQKIREMIIANHLEEQATAPLADWR